MANSVLALGASGGKRQQLPEEVASHVREQIMTGAVRPGDFLRMEPIAEAVGVSNTPVREGLLGLRSEGFVRLVPRRGFVVAPFTRQDVRDLFWSQSELGGELAARATKKITPAQIAKLASIDDEHAKAAAAGDKDSLAQLGHAFHREINLAADSRRLTLLLASIVKHLPNRFYTGLERQVAATRQHHPLLIEALRKRQGRTARSIMHQHISEGADYVIEILEERGLWDHEQAPP